MHSDFHILLIEDSRADVKIIERALAEAAVDHRLTVLRDGRQALDYIDLLGRPDAPASHHPDLVLLDLNLPGIDGNQVLGKFKGHPFLRVIPVVILTTSSREVDVFQTYQAGANTYVQKPSEYPLYRDLVRILETYWHATALRPDLSRPRP